MIIRVPKFSIYYFNGNIVLLVPTGKSSNEVVNNWPFSNTAYWNSSCDILGSKLYKINNDFEKSYHICKNENWWSINQNTYMRNKFWLKFSVHRKEITKPHLKALHLKVNNLQINIKWWYNI